jgi:hypothetical protein
MNAFDWTIRGMAMLGKPRAKQSVHRLTSAYGGFDIFGAPRPSRHVVLVTPDGAERGEYYEVSDREKRRLEDGVTPDELELEPHIPDEADEDEYEVNFFRRIGAF